MRFANGSVNAGGVGKAADESAQLVMSGQLASQQAADLALASVFGMAMSALIPWHGKACTAWGSFTSDFAGDDAIATPCVRSSRTRTSFSRDLASSMRCGT